MTTKDAALDGPMAVEVMIRRGYAERRRPLRAPAGPAALAQRPDHRRARNEQSLAEPAHELAFRAARYQP
ncbi:hypothetical protein AB0J74_05530 [Asanoa sp. NPDC049573]|uniref:hypothetical protein n=1 Tax=Asanoa sp. NPDC049573 TaxID=3155396 RepID=UPI00344335A8